MASYKRVIEISDEELDAVEDAFFAENSKEEWKLMRPILLKVWENLCPPEKTKRGTIMN